MITRIDVLIIAFWQVLLLFNVQMLMPIFLNYMPAQKCKGLDYTTGFCYNVHEKCNKCVEQCDYEQNICKNNETCFLAIKQSDVFYSAAEEYGHFCNSHLRFIRVDTMQYVGALLGTIASGVLAGRVRNSDAFGRRRVLMFVLGIGLPALLLSGEVKHVVWFYFFRFVVGLFNGAGLVVGWSYVSELISAKKRMLLRVLSSWPLARLMMTLVCYSTGEWRKSTRTLFLLMLPVLPVLFFLLPESHIWLASKGRRPAYAESIARINWLAGCVYAKKSDHHFTSKAASVGLKAGLSGIVRHPLLRKRMLVLLSFWCVTFYSYYLLDLNTESMFDRGFFVGQFTLCGVLVGTKLMLGVLDQFVPGVNRKRVHLVAQAGVVVFVAIMMVMHYLGNKVRGSASGASSLVARLATVAATATTALKDVFEPIVYICIIVLSVGNWLVSLFLLDESKGADLKEVARDRVPFSRKPSNIPTISVNDVFVFDHVDDTGSRRMSDGANPTTEKATAENKEDDLGFSDLIFWTPSASNPTYDPAAEYASEIAVNDEENKNDVPATSFCTGGVCQTLKDVNIDVNNDENEATDEKEDEKDSIVMRF